ncbi:AAA family ATPase [Phaeocystidibacter marisrubri]|uniref:ATP-binding protein n=1 Tax=Phaeocystidibacter marisrubri TaxID=1577780 RepID=A0A6L3ZJR9_9FLAO|nr:ATP-binding protein [Phaeocystidibacter marisrubri]KAB2817655.1 ATP-binding protein [Phaeocystidibacter marisrubri]GGH74270.1 ATPase [Phaeocystidibacter marisrubri]
MIRIGISGGPGTGKTSIIQELEQRGHTCFHEYSREVIKHSLENNSDVLPWDNLPAFTEKVIEGRLTQYHSAQDRITSFYDRTIIDSIAYQHVDHLPVKPEWDQLAKIHRYHERVFITPPWEEIYQQDNERRETLEKLIRIHEILCHTYEDYGYRVIEIPKASLSERTDWLLEQI